MCAHCTSLCKSDHNVLNVQLVREICSSFCDESWDLQAVCGKSKDNGQESFYPSLRACTKWIDAGIKCSIVAVYANSADCEDKNKKAM